MVSIFQQRSMIGYRAAMLRLGNTGLCFSANRTLTGSWAKIRPKSNPSGLGISRGYKINERNQLTDKIISVSKNPSSVVTPRSADQGEEIELLTAFDDDHGGVIVDMKAPMNSKEFLSSLRASILNWGQQGKRGVWLKLPIEYSKLVHPAVEEGFCYHHAEPSYLMLVYWIPATKSTLPVNATHRVGVGAFVMNDQGEVLAVQERSGKLRGSGMWKLPTGVVDQVNTYLKRMKVTCPYMIFPTTPLSTLFLQGEDIFAGAIREVKEETGIDTEFVEVLAFRQSHKSFFEKSDLFFVCMLRPLSFEIRKQKSEIEAAQWMPFKEFAAQPFAQKHDLLRYIISIGSAKVEKSYTGFSPVRIKSAFSDRHSYMYLSEKGLDQPTMSGNVSEDS